MLRLDDGTCLTESNAILYYLAEGSRFCGEEVRMGYTANARSTRRVTELLISNTR